MSISSALSGLSTSCAGSLTTLLTSNFATCADVLQLASVSDLSSANSTLNSGCSGDLKSGALIPTALSQIITNYNGVRDLLCTKYRSNNTYCITQTLGAAQNATGTQFTISQLTSLMSGQDTANFLSAIPKSSYCTDCGHAITTEALKIVQNVQSSAVSTVQSAASGKCGANFSDGSLPSTITTTSTANSTSANAASASTKPNAAAHVTTPHFLSVKSLAILGTLFAAALGATIA
ncbi:hypothetical protein EMMF5_003322 [Cystobasidiomycetes sp. EMM_F5]